MYRKSQIKQEVWTFYRETQITTESIFTIQPNLRNFIELIYTSENDVKTSKFLILLDLAFYLKLVYSVSSCQYSREERT